MDNKARAKGSVDLSESAQDYLEAIIEMESPDVPVRVAALAQRLGVSRPAVVAALRRLAGRGLVRHERYAHVTLTETGRAAARLVAGRHRLLVRFLSELLGVGAQAAEADACRMEHALSAGTMRRMVRFLDFAADPEGDARCRDQFERFLATGRRCECGGRRESR